MTVTMAHPRTDPSSNDSGSDNEILELGAVVLQAGVTLPDARLAYRTYGTLNAAGDNAVLMPTFFGGQHTDTEPMMAPGRALDPERHLIIVPDLFGDGLSSSPSTTPPPFDGPGFPPVTLYDNVTCQHRLVTERFGLDRLNLVVGFSMGAQQAYQWAATYPDMVDNIAVICGSVRTSPNTYRLLEGVRTAATSAVDFHDGWYPRPPSRALLALCRTYCSLVVCPQFYREEQYTKLGLASPDDLMRFFEGFFRQRDLNDLLAKLWTFQHADISANPVHQHDLAAALGAIKARTMILTSETDLLFPVVDSHAEAQLIPNAELRPIPSIWGHIAGLGANPPDNEFIDTALNELLGS
jgi:homoserine O-acetyltransferase/O-succinyltransferase